jgi:hypothetical protein
MSSAEDDRMPTRVQARVSILSHERKLLRFDNKGEDSRCASFKVDSFEIEELLFGYWSTVVGVIAVRFEEGEYHFIARHLV